VKIVLLCLVAISPNGMFDEMSGKVDFFKFRLSSIVFLFELSDSLANSLADSSSDSLADSSSDSLADSLSDSNL
jgi:hypothetical protein